MWRRRLADLISYSAYSSFSKSAHSNPQCIVFGIDGVNTNAFFTTDATAQVVKEADPDVKRPFITFVLGGPGSGKGTQCQKIAQTFGFKHLSAGDLLREEVSSDGQHAKMIRDIIKEGKIVPSEITVKLIQKAIESSENKKILIDGFPRSEENRIAFEKIIGVEPDLVLFFNCPEDEMVRRVLTRNQGRIDDNIDTMQKRLKIYEDLNIPVIDYYSAKGKVYKINAVGTVDEIFEKVRSMLASWRGHEMSADLFPCISMNWKQ